VTPSDTLPSFGARFWLAWVSFFQVLFNPSFAARVLAVRGALTTGTVGTATRDGTDGADTKGAAARAKGADAPTAAAAPTEKPEDGALSLLAALQREGRLVDFLEQDIASFSDADIGAAARVVHEGCRKALRTHVKLAPVRGEDEGTTVTLPSGFRAAEVKLTGAVAGSGPYKGVLRHRGWKATGVTLPLAMHGHDAHVIAAAEVEL
jgi:hypothetical protein